MYVWCDNLTLSFRFYVLRLFHSVTNCYITVPLFCLNEERTIERVVSFSIILFSQSNSSLNKTVKDNLV